MRHPLGLGCLTRESALASIWFAKNAPHRIINVGGVKFGWVGLVQNTPPPRFPPFSPVFPPFFPRFSPFFLRFPPFSPFSPVFPRFPPFFPATGNQTPIGYGNLGPLLGILAGLLWFVADGYLLPLRRQSLRGPTDTHESSWAVFRAQEALIFFWSRPSVPTNDGDKKDSSFLYSSQTVHS